ncbi:hypothetical protein [Methylobacterium sp. AMS5]|uniref:hypothetical protein n=1 Tax=Methylobacterium sp. AMS5 TaxID=925818 RepID=UPI00074FA3EF|nr:hypothetical protein [Methylobacterium sp. AMS5]AMB48304.1 hypothetical protein Y590_25385 [Methylobacterium sp. AMS5]
MTERPDITVRILDGHTDITVVGDEIERVKAQAEEHVRFLLMRGAGVGVDIKCEDQTIAVEIRAHLDQVAHDIASNAYRVDANTRMQIEKLTLEHGRRQGKTMMTQTIVDDYLNFNRPLTQTGNRHARRKAKALKGRG